MKKILLMSLMILMFPTVFAMDMDLEVITDKNLDAGIDLHAGGNVTVDISVDTAGNVKIDESYNNYYSSYNTYNSHSGGTNPNSVFRILTESISKMFDQEPDYDSEYEFDMIGVFSKFGSYIEQLVYGRHVRALELEVLAQRKINQKLTMDLEEIKEKLNMEQDEHSLECYGYLRVMFESDMGVNSVSCEEHGKEMLWQKSGDEAISITPGR